MTKTGCLNCKHYNPHARTSTPVCMYHGCKFEPAVRSKQENKNGSKR